MEKCFEKLSSYNLLNNLLPGAVFYYFLKFIINISMSNNLIENIFIYYFCGMLISRIGSILIEPIYKKLKIVKYAEYNSFLSACKLDDKINILSETNNMYRTFLSAIIVLGIVKIYVLIASKYGVLFTIAPAIIYFCILVLFSFSYRKQVAYIKKRTEHTCQNDLNNN